MRNADRRENAAEQRKALRGLTSFSGAPILQGKHFLMPYFSGSECDDPFREVGPLFLHISLFVKVSAMSTPISVQGYKKLEKELEALKKERPAVIQAIKEAREEGDLKENAGYDAARERQGFLEARINYIESQLPQYTVIDLDTLHSDKVIFGATVHVVDVDTDEERQFTLLGPDEADFAKGSISINSPVGRALLGHEVGDEVTIDIPRGRVTYEITEIEFHGVRD